VPKIYHVNWFRRDADNKFLWPGYGDNIRVIDWIVRRLDGEQDIGVDTPIGVVPKKGSINAEGLPDIKWDELMSVPKDYWSNDAKEIRKFLDEQVGPDLPKEIRAEMDAQEERINKEA
uniref:Phosphoenolpyruvate carboxykinase C-terminal P-loop domain-containing protein n=1 Tax=Biomphalaria glabrata TaxID=6526 RepID=A0A2C9L9T4_BIOGL